MDAYKDPSRDPYEGDSLDESHASPSGEDFLGLGQGLDAHLGSDTEDDEDYEYSDEDQAASWLFTLDEDTEGSEAGLPSMEPAGAWAEQPAAFPADPAEAGQAEGAEGIQAGGGIVPDAWTPPEEPEAHDDGAYAEDHEEALDAPSMSWTEPESSTGFLRRHAVRLAAAVVVLGVGFAGWQLYGVGGDLVSSPETEVLAPEQNKTPRYAPRLQSPDGSPAAPSNRRAVRGSSDGESIDLANLPPPSASARGGGIAVPEGLLARATPRGSARGRWRTLLGLDAAGGRLLDGLPGLDRGPVGPRTGPRGGDVAGGPNLLRRSGRLDGDLVDVPSFPNLRLATSKDLENVWPGFEIPVDEYGRAERLLTPYVGDVRAVLDSGDIFEGRLYAVGQDRIWVSTGWGVMALETQRLDAVIHVDNPAAQHGAPQAPIARMPTIQVQAVGGRFAARLLYQDDRGATVVTEQGMRITVDPDDVAILAVAPSVVLAEDPLR